MGHASCRITITKRLEMKLIVISNPTPVNKEIQIITSLFEEGLEYFHLRKPTLSSDQLLDFLEEIPSHYHNRIVVHRSNPLFKNYKLRGYHFSRKYGSFNEELNYNSTSFHTLEQLTDNQLPYQYVFLSPVFPSISKKGHAPVYQQNELSHFFQTKKIHAEVIALGGVNLNNALIALKTGFQGVAVLGHLWEAPCLEVLNNFKTLKHTVDNYKNLAIVQ